MSGETNIPRSVSWVVLAMIAAFACFLGYKILFAPPALSYTNVPFPVVDPKPVHRPGEAVLLEVARCNSASTPVVYIITRRIKNVHTGQEYLLPSTMLVFDPGCSKTTSSVHVIPMDTSPGHYVLMGTALVPRLIGTDVVQFASQPFEVVAH